MKKVVIVSCRDQHWWYRGMIGKIVEVKREVGEDYLIHERHYKDKNGEPISLGLVLKSDCILVEEL